MVFDAYKRKDNEGSVEEIGGITVVYTKERQTADAYIENYVNGEFVQEETEEISVEITVPH